MTRAPKSIHEYADLFVEPESLAKTLVIVQDATVMGDLMVAVQDTWVSQA